jgi:hypothetical protein
MSFFLFVCIAVTSVSFLSVTNLLNGAHLTGYFSSYRFVSGYRQDISDYARDKFIKNGLGTENIDSILDYDRAQTISEGYYSYQFRSKKGYSQSTELKELEQLGIDIKKEIVSQLKEKEIEYKDSDVQLIADRICSYAKSRIESSGSEYIKTIMNIAPLALIIVTGFFGALTLLLLMMLVFLGNTRYRSVRAVSISFLSAGVLDALLALTAKIITNIKHIYVFPQYYSDTFMCYVNDGILALAATGGFLFVAATVISTIAWKLKRKDQ